MSAEDEYFNDDDDDAPGGSESADGGEAAGEGAAAQPVDWRNWLNGKRGWILIVGLTIAQALSFMIILMLRSDARQIERADEQIIHDLAVDMLGREVKIKDIFQFLPLRGGKRMSLGMEVVFVLGQLPEEQVAGAPAPNAAEMELFMTAVRDSEPAIRNRLNKLMQTIPVEDLGTVEAQKTMKEDLKVFLNDILDGLNFGKALRKDIGKRRVTDVLFPMFLRQKG